MSLAVVIDVGRNNIRRSVTAAIGLLMTASLLLAAAEQSWSEGAVGSGWLPLACACACAAWCAFLWRRAGGRSPLHLQVTADGGLRLVCPESGESREAAVLRAWSLGRLIFLRVAAPSKVDPAAVPANDGQSASVMVTGIHCFVLARGSFDANRWHALRRWLVWYRRARRSEPVAA
jgi:hypothetical protein